jgi:hypothetical protein
LGVILNQLRKISTAPRPTASVTARILAATSWEFIAPVFLTPWNSGTQAFILSIFFGVETNSGGLGFFQPGVFKTQAFEDSPGGVGAVERVEMNAAHLVL